jgi:phosphatidylglycerophosphatase A
MSSKGPVEKRDTSGVVDHIALAVTTFGVGYIPGAPGTYGSIIGVLIYLGIDRWFAPSYLAAVCGGGLCPLSGPRGFAVLVAAFLAFAFLGIWASGRSESIFGSGDPHQAVVDEVLGQLVTFTFIPFGSDWKWILTGFVLFRTFDILKPYPTNRLQDLPGGLGICADDIAAGVYAGICLSILYAISLSV